MNIRKGEARDNRDVYLLHFILTFGSSEMADLTSGSLRGYYSTGSAPWTLSSVPWQLQKHKVFLN